MAHRRVRPALQMGNTPDIGRNNGIRPCIANSIQLAVAQGTRELGLGYGIRSGSSAAKMCLVEGLQLKPQFRQYTLGLRTQLLPMLQRTGRMKGRTRRQRAHFVAQLGSVGAMNSAISITFSD